MMDLEVKITIMKKFENGNMLPSLSSELDLTTSAVGAIGAAIEALQHTKGGPSFDSR
jgi:hypothetical protein